MKNKNKELEKVNGGMIVPNNLIYCINCSTSFNPSKAEYRQHEDGCENYREYKCPNCGKWVS